MNSSIKISARWWLIVDKNRFRWFSHFLIIISLIHFFAVLYATFREQIGRPYLMSPAQSKNVVYNHSNISSFDFVFLYLYWCIMNSTSLLLGRIKSVNLGKIIWTSQTVSLIVWIDRPSWPPIKRLKKS